MEDLKQIKEPKTVDSKALQEESLKKLIEEKRKALTEKQTVTK